jgi:hypothetical protein
MTAEKATSASVQHDRHGGTTPVRCRGCRKPWPCPEAEAEFLPLKPHTKYVCPNRTGYGHSALWAGALNPAVRSRSDGWCICGAQMVEEAKLHTEMYRLSWEMVGSTHLWRYCNANPTFYKNTTQIVPNSQIPDEHWHGVSREDSNPWQQYHALKAWADADTGFVRNVRLERMASEPRWEPYEPTAKPEGGEPRG